MSKLICASFFLLILANLSTSSPKIRDNRTFKISETEESFSSEDKQPPSTLKLMTFNTWLLGSKVNDGLSKIAKHIKLVDPDIVGLQEVVDNTGFYELVAKLGPQWSPAYINNSNSAIITKHKVVRNETYTVQAGIGATILINQQFPVHCYSMHLAYKSYGPYAANNKKVTDSKILDIGEYFPAYSRVNNIKNLLDDKTFQKWLKLASTNVPLLVLGDFNSPSHLDWTEATKEDHGGWAYKWPATYLLQTKTKLIDTFREVYPNPAKVPGKNHLVYNLGTHSRPMDVKSNDWPSDHYAVVSKLEWDEKKFVAEEKA